MSVCIKTRVIYQVQHFSFFVCCMFTILCYFKNAFKRLQRELKQICSRIGHMAGFYCTLPIPGGMMNIDFCNIMLSWYHVATSFIALTCFSEFMLLIWYLKKWESNVLQLLISMIWKSSFVSGPTCKVDVLSYIPIIYCSHFTFVSFPLAHTYYPIWPTNAKWLVIFIKKYHTMTLQSWHGSYVEINNHKFPKCTCLIFLYNG